MRAVLLAFFPVFLAFCCCLLKILLSFFAFVRVFVPMWLMCVCVETHVHMGFWIFVSPLVSPLLPCRLFRGHVILVFAAFLLLLASESSCPSLLRARRLAGVFFLFSLPSAAACSKFCFLSSLSFACSCPCDFRRQGMLWKWHEAKPRPHFWIGTGLSLQPLLDMAGA